MDGLPVFNEIFDKDPADPLEKTATDGAYHVAKLKANKEVSPVIQVMYEATDTKFSKFMSDKTAFEKGAGDLKIMNGDFDTLENGLNSLFMGYQQKIVGTYPPGSAGYKALFWENITVMFNVGYETKITNIDRFLLTLDDYQDLSSIKEHLLEGKQVITDKYADKVALDSRVKELDKNVRSTQKIFCIEEQGNVGGLMQFYKATPFVCNQYFLVTDIKHYQPTEGAIAKKESHLHSFMPNTITIVSDITLSPNCDPHIKNLSLETVKIGTTYSLTVKPAQKNSLDPGKTFKKKIKFIGDQSNTFLVVDTTGAAEYVTLEITVKNATVKNK